MPPYFNPSSNPLFEAFLPIFKAVMNNPIIGTSNLKILVILVLKRLQ